MVKFVQANALYIAFMQALSATLGSLFFSEVLLFPPCVLCWYQRIAMYPLVVILAVGIYTQDKHVIRYVLPLSVVGLLIAFYHNLLYYHFLPESAAPCILGVSCTTRQVEWFGFITIPLLSFIAFAIITISMLLYRSYLKKQS
ncbi:MAG: disulfide bond formation protein C [Patescibacteria group bacterium]|nr:MAG: disulfide bond formation protein C [Patescibacteria group bacterium]